MTTVLIAALTFLIVLAIGLLGFLSRYRADRRREEVWRRHQSPVPRYPDRRRAERRPGMLPDDVYRRRRT